MVTKGRGREIFGEREETSIVFAAHSNFFESESDRISFCKRGSKSRYQLLYMLRPKFLSS